LNIVIQVEPKLVLSIRFSLENIDDESVNILGEGPGQRGPLSVPADLVCLPPRGGNTGEQVTEALVLDPVTLTCKRGGFFGFFVHADWEVVKLGQVVSEGLVPRHGHSQGQCLEAVVFDDLDVGC